MYYYITVKWMIFIVLFKMLIPSKIKCDGLKVLLFISNFKLMSKLIFILFLWGIGNTKSMNVYKVMY